MSKKRSCQRVGRSLVLVLVILLTLASVVSAAPPAQEGLTYTVKLGDSLWALAEKYLGSGPAYWAIANATNAAYAGDSSFAHVENPSLIQPGWKLLIPSAEEAEKYITVAKGGQLQLAGSTTVQPLAEELAEAFMKLNPDLVIEVQGGGSSVGVTSAGEGTVDIGNASREIKSSEFEKFPDLQVFTIAYDGIAIVTHPDTELDTLSVEQVRDIFAGEITNFSEVGGPDEAIVVVAREEGSGTRAAFEELAMGYKDAAGEKQAKVIFEKALLQQSNGQVRTTVSTTPNSIGFLSFGFLDASTRGVPIDGVEPAVEHVADGSYTIFRPLNMLTNGAPNDLAQAFLDYILGGDGQAIVSEKYISVE